jgi:hypothetical protein
MRDVCGVPELRSTLTKVQELRRQAAYVEAAVAAALFLSICTLLLAFAGGPMAAVWKLGAIA